MVRGVGVLMIAVLLTACADQNLNPLIRHQQLVGAWAGRGARLELRQDSSFVCSSTSQPAYCGPPRGRWSWDGSFMLTLEGASVPALLLRVVERDEHLELIHYSDVDNYDRRQGLRKQLKLSSLLSNKRMQLAGASFVMSVKWCRSHKSPQLMRDSLGGCT